MSIQPISCKRNIIQIPHLHLDQGEILQKLHVVSCKSDREGFWRHSTSHLGRFHLDTIFQPYFTF